MVIVPKHWFFNDWRAWNGGASSSEMAFQQFKDGFDFVLEEALRGKPGRIDALVHAELGGRPYMANALREDDPLRARSTTTSSGSRPATRSPTTCWRTRITSSPIRRRGERADRCEPCPSHSSPAAAALIGEGITRALVARGWHGGGHRHQSRSGQAGRRRAPAACRTPRRSRSTPPTARRSTRPCRPCCARHGGIDALVNAAGGMRGLGIAEDRFRRT